MMYFNMDFNILTMLYV